MRIGIIDIGAAGVVLVLLLLPTPIRPVEDTYTGPSGRYLPRIAEAQAELARRPESGQAAASLAELLMWSSQSDWAFRAAGPTAAMKESTDGWRAAWALSKVHAGRLEIEPAYRWAEEALRKCDLEGSQCSPEDRFFLQVRKDGLEQCVKTGVDPKLDRSVCQQAVRQIVPIIKGQKADEPKK
jgi:hypothetical protein